MLTSSQNRFSSCLVRVSLNNFMLGSGRFIMSGQTFPTLLLTDNKFLLLQAFVAVVFWTWTNVSQYLDSSWKHTRADGILFINFILMHSTNN